MNSTSSSWWRGARGEWYVIGQLVLMAFVFLGPRTLPGLPAWPAPLARVSVLVGAAIGLAGVLLLLAGLARLGPNLTPLPHPTDRATLVQSGPYRFVRHPMYAGGIAMAYGWALFVCGWLTLAYATLLFAFLDAKATREERWLASRFPDYPAYQARVHKLIPFIH
jgi:protein-S-isoprenylcysteine O-methyltransferase Ste14